MSSILTNNTIGISINNNKKDMHETIQTQKINREQKRKKKKKEIMEKKRKKRKNIITRGKK